MAYEAALIAVSLDSNGKYEDIYLVGIVHSKIEANNLLMDDINRLIEDYEDPKEVTVSFGRSMYDYPITCVKYNQGYMHYHLQFTQRPSKEEIEEADRIENMTRGDN